MKFAYASRPNGRLIFFALLFLLVSAGTTVHASDIAKTIVHDTIYRADGAPATGTLLISWPSFRTASHDYVAAGSATAILGDAGVFSIALAPTDGATPATVQYRVVLQLDGASPEVQYWIVPAVAESGIVLAAGSNGSSAFKPPDPNGGTYLLRSGDTMSGPLSLSGDPVNPNHATSKSYVDTAIATATGRNCAEFASLQACHDDLPSPGGKLYLPANTTTTITTSFTITKNNVELECGPGAAITGAFNAPLITATSVDRLKIHGCTLSNTFTSTTSADGLNNVLALTAVTNDDIYSNTFTAGLFGVYHHGGSNNTVRDNSFTGLSVVAIGASWDGTNPADRLSVLRNKVSGMNDWPSWANYTGSAHDINLEDSTNVLVQDNDINGSTGTLGNDARNTIASCIQTGPNHLVGTQPASGAIRGNHCFDPLHHRKAGINFPGSGTTPNVVTEKGLAIVANTVEGPQYCYHSTTLNDGNTDGVLIADGFGLNCAQSGIILNIDSSLGLSGTAVKQDIEISNMKFTGAGATSLEGISLRQVSGVKLHGGAVSNFGGYGVSLRGTSQDVVSGVRIFNNSQVGAGQRAAITVVGIAGAPSNNNELTGNRMEDTQTTPTQTVGISIGATDSGNRVFQNTCDSHCTAPFSGGANTQRGGNSWGDPSSSLSVDGPTAGDYALKAINRDTANGAGGAFIQSFSDGSGNTNLLNLYQNGTQRFAVSDQGRIVFNGPSLLPVVPGSLIGTTSLPVVPNIGTVANQTFTFNTSGLTGNRTLTPPDKNGVIATMADVPTINTHYGYRLCGTTADVIITATHAEQTLLSCTLPALAQGSKLKVRVVAAANATNSSAAINYKLASSAGVIHSSTATGNTQLIEEIDIQNVASASSQVWSGFYSLGGTLNPDYGTTSINTAGGTTLNVTYTPTVDADSRTFKQIDVIVYQ